MQIDVEAMQKYAKRSLDLIHGGKTEDELLQRIWNLANDVNYLIAALERSEQLNSTISQSLEDAIQTHVEEHAKLRKAEAHEAAASQDAVYFRKRMVNAEAVVETARRLAPHAKAAEMRWMSIEDSTIDIPSRAVAEIVRALASYDESSRSTNVHG